jgi:hypothetical protein
MMQTSIKKGMQFQDPDRGLITVSSVTSRVREGKRKNILLVTTEQREEIELTRYYVSSKCTPVTVSDDHDHQEPHNPPVVTTDAVKKPDAPASSPTAPAPKKPMTIWDWLNSPII